MPYSSDRQWFGQRSMAPEPFKMESGTARRIRESEYDHICGLEAWNFRGDIVVDVIDCKDGSLCGAWLASRAGDSLWSRIIVLCIAWFANYDGR